MHVNMPTAPPAIPPNISHGELIIAPVIAMTPPITPALTGRHINIQRASDGKQGVLQHSDRSPVNCSGVGGEYSDPIV